MTISLGGGHNVMNLAEELHQSSITNITLCSPSELTRMNVHPLDEINGLIWHSMAVTVLTIN